MSGSIRYVEQLDEVIPAMLREFFEGWPDPPSEETHLRILRGSAHVVLAVDDETRRVVGFVNAISDGVMSAYVPLLEVLPEYRGRGIGRELVQRMLDRLDHLYMVDLVCDPDVLPFYQALGFMAGVSAMRRNWARQSCTE